MREPVCLVSPSVECPPCSPMSMPVVAVPEWSVASVCSRASRTLRASTCVRGGEVKMSCEGEGKGKRREEGEEGEEGDRKEKGGRREEEEGEREREKKKGGERKRDNEYPRYTDIRSKPATIPSSSTSLLISRAATQALGVPQGTFAGVPPFPLQRGRDHLSET